MEEQSTAERVASQDRQERGSARSGSSRARWGGRPEAYALLELCALSGLAIGQPVLDAVGRSPDFLVFHGATTPHTLLLVAAIVVLPPLALWGVGAATRLVGPRTRWAVHTVSLGGLATLFAVEVGKQVSPLRGLPLIALAVVAGAAACVAYATRVVVRQVLRLAAAGPLVFVLLFVFASPASAVVLGRAGPTVAAAAEVGPHPPIVVIVLDELPLVSLMDAAGRVDGARLPNFAGLAAGSTWYRNATAVSPHTTYAVPAMLTGRYPTGELAPHHSQYPENLFTLLRGAYDVHAWETITQLCPPETCRGRPGQPRGGLTAMAGESAALLGKITSPYDSVEDPTAGFREVTVAEARGRSAAGARPGPPEHDRSGGDRPEHEQPGGGQAEHDQAEHDQPGGDQAERHRLDHNQPARFADFMATLDAPGRPHRPTLRFLHLLVPHSPWQYLPSGTRYSGPGSLPFDGQWWARLAHQRHLQQVGYADRLLGEALAGLKAAGQYDESLIVVTSDHGDSFSQGVSGRDLDGPQRAAAEIAWVPMFVKEPGQTTGRVDDRNWQQVDLLPTIADHAGVRIPWAVDGVSALGSRRTGTAKRFDQAPGEPLTIETPAHFPAVLRGQAARPVLPGLPPLALVGRPVAQLPVAEGGPPVRVANRGDFADVRPHSGTLPALVDGWLSDAIAPGTPMAIAVNGRIGAVALAADDRRGDRRVVGLITDEELFVAGPNRLELYVVTGDAAGWGLTRMAVN